MDSWKKENKLNLMSENKKKKSEAQNEFLRAATIKKRGKGRAVRRLTDGSVAIAYRAKLISKKQYEKYVAAK